MVQIEKVKLILLLITNPAKTANIKKLLHNQPQDNNKIRS